MGQDRSGSMPSMSPTIHSYKVAPLAPEHDEGHGGDGSRLHASVLPHEPPAKGGAEEDDEGQWSGLGEGQVGRQAGLYLIKQVCGTVRDPSL